MPQSSQTIQAKPSSSPPANPFAEFMQGKESADTGDTDMPSGVNGMVPAAAKLAVPDSTSSEDAPTTDAPVGRLPADNDEDFEPTLVIPPSAKAPSKPKAEAAVSETPAPGEQEQEQEQEQEVPEELSREDELLKMLGVGSKEKAGTTKAPANQTTATPASKVSSDSGKRDYTGFDETEVKVLKRVPNESFNYFKQLINENKVLKAKAAEAPVAAKVPGSVLDHEEGYVLSPEYKAAQKELAYAQALEEHWAKQYEAVRSGKDWQDLEQDEKGNIRLVSRESSPAAEAAVARKLNQVSHAALQVQGKVQSVAQTFQQTRAQQLAAINQTAQRYFPMYENPAPKTKAMLDELGQNLTRLGIGPNNPAFALLQKSAALNFELQNILKTRGTQARVESIQASAGPTNSHAGGAVKAPGTKPRGTNPFAEITQRSYSQED